jgi:hypothetical protein
MNAETPLAHVAERLQSTLVLAVDLHNELNK